MSVLIIANALIYTKSPAYGIEQDLLNGLAAKGIEIHAVTSSVGDITKCSNLYTTQVVKEYKEILYLFALAGCFLPDLKWLPDSTYYSWGKFVEKKVSITDKTELIHSIGFANACHWVAYQMKRKYKIPWIASFFDSWTDYPTRRFKTSFFRNIDKSMERKVAENADYIVHNNYETAKIWEERYGPKIAKKIVVIPFNIDFSKEKVSHLDISNKEVLNITHIGTFYPYRNASSIINGIAYFVDKYPQLQNKIKINFVGKVLDSDISLIRLLGIEKLFNIVGSISSEECQEYYRNADVFLSTAGDYGENVMFPSKIIKYFFYNRPILGISPIGTITENELKRAGHKCFQPKDKNGLADYIKQMIDDYASVCGYNKDYWKRFSNESIVEKYINIYKKV